MRIEQPRSLLASPSLPIHNHTKVLAVVSQIVASKLEDQASILSQQVKPLVRTDDEEIGQGKANVDDFG